MVACAATAGSVTKVPPCPSDDSAKLDAMYWPSSAMEATCEPSDTVSVPPVLAAFSEKPSVVPGWLNRMSPRSMWSPTCQPEIAPVSADALSRANVAFGPPNVTSWATPPAHTCSGPPLLIVVPLVVTPDATYCTPDEIVVLLAVPQTYWLPPLIEVLVAVPQTYWKAPDSTVVVSAAPQSTWMPPKCNVVPVAIPPA